MSSKTKSTQQHNPTQNPEESTIFSLTSNTNLLLLENKNDFYGIVKEIDNRLLVIEFFASWCGPCQRLAPKLEEAAEAYNGKILIVKVDVEEFEELAQEYDISSMPTILIMKNQKKLEQFSSSNSETLNKSLEKYAGKPGSKLEEAKKNTKEPVGGLKKKPR